MLSCGADDFGAGGAGGTTDGGGGRERECERDNLAALLAGSVG